MANDLNDTNLSDQIPTDPNAQGDNLDSNPITNPNQPTHPPLGNQPNGRLPTLIRNPYLPPTPTVRFQDQNRNRLSTTSQLDTTIDQPTQYITLPQKKVLKCYTGEPSGIRIQAWLVLYERHINTNDPYTLIRDLVYSLDKEALSWYAEEIASEEHVDWNAVKSLMITRFGSEFKDPLLEAQRIRLERTETVTEYYRRKIKLLREAKLAEHQVISQLTSGLPFAWTLHMSSGRPRTLSDWLEIATETEMRYKQKEKFLTKQQPKKPAAKTLVAAPPHNNSRPRQSAERRPPVCRYCERLGKKENHWHRECPNRSQTSQPRPSTHTAEEELHPDDHGDVCFAKNISPILKFIDIPLTIEGISVEAFIDTGSTISIMSLKTCKRLNLPINNKQQITINQLEGSTKSVGYTLASTTIHKTTKTIKYHIISNFRYPILIGLNTSIEFGLHLNLEDKTVSIRSPETQELVTLLGETHEKDQLAALIEKHKSAFAQNETDIGRITVAKHRITTINHPPIQLRAYRRPQAELDEISRQVKEYKEKGLVRDSESPWAFPVTCVPKKDGGTRLCIDFRRLNALTIDDKMPLPRINDVIDRLQGSKYFSTLDVKWGYWHIEMDPESIEKTAFVTHEGHYEWLVMPFGLKNAPATFQRILQRVLGSLLYNGAINYLDDIIIYSKTFSEHLQLLEKIFTLCKDNNIKLKLSKCDFAQNEVDYLGYIISEEGVRPSKQKVKAVEHFPVPSNVKEVRQFLGLANYYRRFIDKFSTISKPLTRLLCKNIAFHWKDEHQTAFQILKNKLINEPVLAIYNKDEPCTLYTDASKIGIGATLVQTDKHGLEHPIAYFSKALNEHQGNYTAFELECLAVVEAVDHFEAYLSLPFKVITDHSALKWLLTLKKPKGRLYRWSIKLSTRSYELFHRAGVSQQHVDALSRAPVTFLIDADEIKQHQATTDFSHIQQSFKVDGIVTVKTRGSTRAIIPPTLRNKVLQHFHDDYSHPGKNKTVKLITRFYWWPHMISDIKAYVDSCRSCQLVKQTHRPSIGQMILPSVDLEPGDLVGLDTIVMGPAAGSTRHKYIQVFIDHFSRYVWAFPTTTNTSASVVTLLDKLIQSGIRIKAILTDCHKNFQSTVLKQAFKRHNIKHIFSTPYHPQTNGIVERINGTLMVKVRAALQDHPHRKWTTLLPKIVTDYNNTPHDITGYAPAYLFFGTDPTPTFSGQTNNLQEARELARTRTRTEQERRKQRHDAKHPVANFEIGSKVLKEVPFNHPSKTKVTAKYTGPYYVIKKITDVTYIISESLSGTPIQAHSSQLKQFVDRQQTQITVGECDDD
uniref:RNA-directed DNA polymerase n=1 Tax=Tetranychus urticae TaxID=32264 RepID=A0A158P4S6_TETUR